MKRVLSFFICFILLFSTVTIGVNATTEKLEFVEMPIKIGDTTKVYNVIKSGDDYLMEVDTLGIITGYMATADGYSLNSPDNVILFRRGNKEIRIDLLNNNSLILNGNNTSISITNIKHDNIYYYVSMAELLPYLNSYCLLDENDILNIYVDETSIWDLLDNFDINDYQFDFTNECKKAGIDSNFTRITSIIKSKGLGIVSSIIPIDIFDGISVDSYLTYYEILEDMINNKTNSDLVMKELFSTNKKANSVLSVFDKLSKNNLDEEDFTFAFPSAFKKIKTSSDVLKKVENGVKYITYLDIFEESDKEALNIIESMTLNREYYKYDNSMIFAGIKIRESYTDRFAGSVNMFCNKLLQDSINNLLKTGMSDSEILSWCLTTLNLQKAFSTSADKEISRLSYYETLGAAGKAIYSNWKKNKRSNFDSLETMRHHVILYLYSMEKCYSAMDKLFNKGSITSNLYDTKIANCQEMRAKFKAVGNGETPINDSNQYKVMSTDPFGANEYKLQSGKVDYVKEIKKLFLKMSFDVDLPNPPDDTDCFSYSILNDGTGMITGYTGNKTDIVIPSEINGITITKISDWAFKNNTEIKKIDIPDSITDIGDNNIYSTGAFRSCTSLESIVIPNSVHTIHSYTFYNCTNLSDISISDNIIEIGVRAFEGTFAYNNNSNWYNNVLYIDECVIDTRKKETIIEHSIIPNTKIIANFAFRDCNNLKNINIPNSIINIGAFAFEDCKSLEYVSVPQSVLVIDTGAFLNCVNLSKISLVEGLMGINNSAFQGCINLSSLTIPKSVNYLASSFYGTEVSYGSYENYTLYVYPGTYADEKYPLSSSLAGILYGFLVERLS